MDLRRFLEQTPGLQRVKRSVSCRLEAAGLLKALDGRPVLLEQVEGSAFKVAGNVFATKEAVARYLGIETRELIPRMVEAIERPTRPEEISAAPCQEVEHVGDEVDLDNLPLLLHCERDGGNYISSGVVVARSPAHGQNLDFHRMMQLDRRRLSVRVVSGRHFHRFLEEQRRMPVAVCVGNGAAVMLAAATSVALGQDELEIANSLEPIRVTRARSFDALIPADCELVLEGTIDIEERLPEGPFVDLTGTYDTVRQEPVLTVDRITHRRDAIWQALLPGGLEHRVMMGMPREPTIFREVSRAGVRCRDVHINPGGCSWMHTIIQIDQRQEDDGRRALEAAFRGHASLKHAFVVDDDINIYDPLSVEWALATRFQGDRDLMVVGREPGSSLDPSAESETKLTHKLGFDLTKPLSERARHFERAAFPQLNPRDYLDPDRGR